MMTNEQRRNITAALKTAEAELKARGFHRVASVLADDGSSGIIYSNGQGERYKVNFDLDQGKLIARPC